MRREERKEESGKGRNDRRKESRKVFVHNKNNFIESVRLPGDAYTSSVNYL